MISESTETLELAKRLCVSAVPALNDSKLLLIIVITIILMVLSIIAVILRLAARKVSKVNYWWDDYLAILALVRAPHSKDLHRLTSRQVLAVGLNVITLENGAIAIIPYPRWFATVAKFR